MRPLTWSLIFTLTPYSLSLTLEIIKKPWKYKNRLLELVNERHEISVQMLTYIFEGKFTNKEIWDLIEDYFLGIIPEDILASYESKTGNKLSI